jgi:hypothetical protein
MASDVVLKEIATAVVLHAAKAIVTEAHHHDVTAKADAAVKVVDLAREAAVVRAVVVEKAAAEATVVEASVLRRIQS